MWGFIKKFFHYSFVGMSVLAVSFVVALVANFVEYHPFWGSKQTIAIFISYVLISAFAGAGAKTWSISPQRPKTIYRTTSSSTSLSLS